MTTTMPTTNSNTETTIRAYGLMRLPRGYVYTEESLRGPLGVWDSVEADDERGIYILPNAQGDWCLLRGHYWVAVAYDPTEASGCWVPRCRIVEVLDPEDPNRDPGRLLSWFDVSDFDSETAYCWGRYIGNLDDVIDRVTEPDWCFLWTFHFGDQGVMVNRVTGSEWATEWARVFGDQEVMKPKVTDPYWIGEWNRWFPCDQIEA